MGEANQPTSWEEDEKILHRIPLEILLLAAVAAIVIYILFDAASALLLFAGGILSALSFIWLKQSLTRFLFKEKRKALKSAFLLYGLRLLLIILVFFIIIFFFSKKIFAFIAGFSAIVPVLLFEALAAYPKLIKWKN